MRAILLATIFGLSLFASSWAGEKNPSAFDINVHAPTKVSLERIAERVDTVAVHNAKLDSQVSAVANPTNPEIYRRKPKGGQRRACLIWADEKGEHIMEIRCMTADKIVTEMGKEKETGFVPFFVPDQSSLYDSVMRAFDNEDAVEAAEEMDLLLKAKSPANVFASRWP